MSNNQGNSVSSVLSVAKKPSVARSFHHRMARLIMAGDYCPPCQVAGCPKYNGISRAARFVCEWDQQQGARTVSRRRLCCAEHAGNFALKHNIYMADLPEVTHSQLETASRDDWRYADDQCHHEGHEETRRKTSVCSVSSVAHSEEK